MNQKRKDKIKDLLLELASPEEREKFIMEDHRDLKKGIESLFRAIDAIEARRQEDSKNLVTLVQQSIAEARGEIIPLSEDLPNIKKAVVELRDVYEKHKESFEDRSSKMTKALRGDLEKKIDKVTESLKSLNDTVYSHPWGGSTRTIYLNGDPISPENMYSDVNLIPGSNISISAVNNPDTLQVDVTISSSGGGSSLLLEVDGDRSIDQNTLNLISGTNVRLETDGRGGVIIGQAYPSFIDQEIPSGLVNGSNVNFGIAKTPTPLESLMLFVNGGVQFQGADYTLSTTAITFNASAIPSSGSYLQAWYRYQI